MFGNNLKRGPQIITPKDLGIILAYTGVGNDSRIVDAGTGSGYLTIFLAKHLKPCKIYSYEREKRFLKIASENIKKTGLSEYITLKNKDVTKGIDESELDLITLDLKDADKVISESFSSLKVGGELVIYSPTIDHLERCIEKIRDMKFKGPKTIEVITREWKTERTIRPKTKGIMHTGFLTFTKKKGL